jgi:23S rRNA pseudouridine2605 synthase
MAKATAQPTPENITDNTMRLNKYLAHAGIAARRKADELILHGYVTVNNEVVKEMGYRVKESDIVKYKNKIIKPTRNYVYVLLNKPKDFITTNADEQNRKTVLDLVKNATTERVYPVGRLDRNTTGLLLLTNDGELAQLLSHPSYEVEKIYQVQLNNPLSVEHEKQIIKGIKLDDGEAKVNELAFPKEEDRTQVGIAIHIGWNRVVRRIFEHLDYKVEKLDRIVYAGLTKKNLPRGKWRLLETKEVMQLKQQSKKRPKL